MSLEQYDISAEAVACLEKSRLEEIIRKGEQLVLIQLENLRGIDIRATRIMTGAGLLLTILFGLLGSAASIKEITHYAEFKTLVICAAIFGLVCIYICLRIIQSDKMYPIGNDPLILLKDVSDQYSLHESLVDYCLGLSESQVENERLVQRNGDLLRWASISFMTMLVSILFGGLWLF